MRSFLASLFLLLAAPALAQTWVEESAHQVPSSNTRWHRMVYDAAGGRLFVARGADGVLAWDPALGEGRTIEDSAGANAVILAAPFGRAYVPMADGTLLTFDLHTLRKIDRLQLSAGDLRTGLYEPTTKRVQLVTGDRPEHTSILTLDAETGTVLARAEFNSRAIGTPAADGEGTIYAPMRDRNLLQSLDARDLSLQKAWRLGECQQPGVVHWQASTRRLLIACGGERPVLVALDPAAGVVGTVPIGHGVNGLAVDEARHLIVTANGDDSSATIIRQTGPNGYELVETMSTRPKAATLAIDPATSRLFTAAASFTQPAPRPDGTLPPPIFHPDSFTVLTFRPG